MGWLEAGLQVIYMDSSPLKIFNFAVYWLDLTGESRAIVTIF